MFNSFSLLLDYSQFFSKKRIVRVLLFSKKKKYIYIYIYIFQAHNLSGNSLTWNFFFTCVWRFFCRTRATLPSSYKKWTRHVVGSLSVPIAALIMTDNYKSCSFKIHCKYVNWSLISFLSFGYLFTEQCSMWFTSEYYIVAWSFQQ